MSDEGRPVGSIGPVRSDALLRPRSDFTYQTISDRAIGAVSLYQSLFTGALIRGSSWTGTIFDRSDLDGLRVEKTRFAGCSFGRCDVRSTYFVDCHFADCRFDDSLISDCDFAKVTFASCSFRGSSLSSSRFEHSRLLDCNFSPGTFIHNHLNATTIDNTTLADCTALYLVLRDCVLNRVRLNAESVGAILGLTEEHLANVDLVYLGKAQPAPSADLKRLVVEEYERRAWFLGLLVHALNFGGEEPVQAFANYLARTTARFTAMGFAKGEELRFIGDILDELADQGRLPLLTAFDIRTWCTDLSSTLNSIDQSSNSASPLSSLMARSSVVSQRLIERLDDSIEELRRLPELLPVIVRVSFEYEPELGAATVMKRVEAALDTERVGRTALVETRAGSFVEIITTTVGALMALQVCFYLLNGCLIQMTEMKHRFRVLVRRETPAYKEAALLPIQKQSPTVMAFLHGLVPLTKQLASLNPRSLGGFTRQNAKTIDIDEA